jgi:hypothetical protein
LQLWEQLLLPIKSGGLGLPDYMKSHQCAYSASIYECSQTISNYFPNFLDMDTNKTANYFYNSISNISLLRNNIANSLPPISLIEINKIYSEGGARSLQSKLCQLYAENTYDIIKKKKTDPNDLAFFISISDNSGFCGKWLEIAPKNSVLKIPPNNFVTQLCYRFRLEIPNFVPNIKCTCTRQPYLDKFGYHLATACPRSKHRFITHDEMVLLFKEFLNYSGLKTIHEEVGCFHACDLEDDRRPDLSVISFPGVIGKMIVDFSLTCPTPVNSTVVLSLNQALTPDRANDRTYQSKITKYQKAICDQYIKNGARVEDDLKPLKTIAMVATLGSLFSDSQKTANDWKTRILRAGLEKKGLEIPADWDTLTEDEKTKRLDGAIECLK